MGAIALLSLAGCASTPGTSALHALEPQTVNVKTVPATPARPEKTAQQVVEEILNPSVQQKAAEPDKPVETTTPEGEKAPDGPPGLVTGEPEQSCKPALCQRVLRWDAHIEDATEKCNVDPNLVRGIIAQESQGYPRATSHAGAKGLMQLMPETARDLGVRNRTNPKQNIKGGTCYISGLLEDYDGDVEKALWAYNAGPGNQQKGIKPAETVDYIEKVMEYARQFRDYTENLMPWHTAPEAGQKPHRVRYH